MDDTEKPKPPPEFRAGEALSPTELRTAYARIHGRPVPRGADLHNVAGALDRENRNRFVHEVNRQRGYALDLHPDGSIS